MLTTRIQAISLPAHHLDRPGDTPKPKGFALVTFADEADAARLAADWPWLPRRAPTSSPAGQGAQNGEGESELTHEAAKYGFRVLRKERWDELKEEYLAYRQRLLDEIAHAEASGPNEPRSTLSAHPVPRAEAHRPQGHTDAHVVVESANKRPSTSSLSQSTSAKAQDALDPSL